MSYGNSHQVGIRLKCRVARIVAGLGCFVLFVGAMLHLTMAYPLVARCYRHRISRPDASWAQVGIFHAGLRLADASGNCDGGDAGRWADGEGGRPYGGTGCARAGSGVGGDNGLVCGNEIYLAGSVLVVAGGLLLEGANQGRPSTV